MIVFSYQDFTSFKEWIELNISNITWEGKYEKDFREFWSLFFVEELSFNQIIMRFEFASHNLKTGPLISWFSWLREKLICFSFIYKNASIKDIAEQTKIPFSKVTMLLRDFFVERYPYLEERLNTTFQISDKTSSQIHLTYNELKKQYSLSSAERGSLDTEVMRELEITLYPEWRDFLKRVRQSFLGKKFNLDKIRERTSFKRQLRFLREVIVLFLAGTILILLLKLGNNWYEKYLIQKVSLYEPNLFWLDRSLTFKVEEEQTVGEIALSSKEIENLEKQEAQDFESEKFEEERFDVESDVILTSVDSLPKNIDEASLEQSDFEEGKGQKSGYRDSLFGSRKAYRIMMNSVSPREAREKVKKIMQIHTANAVGRVKPGIEIPGGIYFNLFVPQKNLTKFLTNVSEVEQTTLYISKTRRPSPAGLVRVFVWIKSI